MNASAADINALDRPGAGLSLGLDTGGTYTDAVLLADGRRIVAAAKSLTTHWNLAIGIGHAIRAVLAAISDGADPDGAHPEGTIPGSAQPVGAIPGGARADIDLVSVSTTLATNAVVEGRFSPVCTLLIGFDEGMIARSGLEQHGGSVVRIGGGHGADGEETAALDEPAILRAVAENASRVEAFAVAANFSVRNPAHELRARQIIRAQSHKPVTCAHELTSKLDAPRRALTAALNARLTPQIRHLIEALSRVLAEESIDAPLMIVKGDGSLMRADIALEYPVETILSGPAASVVGAGFLTGLQDFIVSDMGGTTTDIAVVSGGRPVVRAEGALVGAWRTMVEAVDVRTSGLGGDSEVYFDRQQRLCVGPRKAMPLSLLAHSFPETLAPLRSLAELERLPDYPAQFAFRNPGRTPAAHAAPAERQMWESLGLEPKHLSTLVRSKPGLATLRRLADAGLATLAAFTPTDALHVLGRQDGWVREAAECGARILATEERNARAARAAVTPEALCERTVEHVVRESGRLLLGAALAHDPGLDAAAGRWGLLGERLLEDTVAGRPFSGLVRATLGLARPLIAIGAPVRAYYPEVARRLGASLQIPDHAAVCNAVGAVAGVVSQTVAILVNQPAFKIFRVHDPAGIQDYPEAEPALAHARRVSRELALAAARRAGAADPQVDTIVDERRARGVPGADYLAEAIVKSTATGRPLAGHGSAAVPNLTTPAATAHGATAPSVATPGAAATSVATPGGATGSG